MGKQFHPLDLEGARDRVIQEARRLEVPFDASDDIDVGRLMDALMWLDMVKANRSEAARYQREEER